MTTDDRSEASREIAALRDMIGVRFAAMDKAVELIQATFNRTPSVAEVYRTLIDFRELLEQSISSNKSLFETQLRERDSRTEATTRDSKIAVDAAFAAAKEAVALQNSSNALSISKSEAATMKQMEAMNEKIDDLKNRITTAEDRRVGGDDSGKTALIIVGIVVSVMIGMAGVITGIMGYLGRHAP